MIGPLQAIKLKASGSRLFNELTQKVCATNFDNLVMRASQLEVPIEKCASEPEERGKMISHYASDIPDSARPARVRLEGGFSSFSIPATRLPKEPWQARYALKSRSSNALNAFLSERESLEAHAREGGCRLLIHHGLDLDVAYGAGAKFARLSILVHFLESMRDDLVDVVLVNDHDSHNLMFVGDWFMAESYAVRMVTGIQQTLFTTHAPTVSARLADYDRSFEELLKEQGTIAGHSRRWAINELRRTMRTLPKPKVWKGYPPRS